jgi:enoyl-CoA hydratase
MSFQNIVFETSGDGIATLTVNRPAKLNAINRATMSELGTAFDQAAASPEVKGLVVTGAGEKSFVAGADIGELAKLSPLETEQLSRFGQATFRKLELLGKPSVAAIQGFALGAGLELAMACTLRVAASGAKLGLPEVKLGLLPGYGGSQRLPRLVGMGRALELLLTGEPITGEQALPLGLVNQVCEPQQVQERARELLIRILKNGPAAIALALRAVDVGMSSGLDEGLRFEAAAFGLAAATEDSREGTAAFVEKRPANFQGR